MKVKKSIAMLIIPAFVIGTTIGCSESGSGVATQSETVVQTPEGQFVQVADTLNKSYEQAKAGGYTGTYEEWVKLLELHQQNPQAASQQAQSQGFDGMNMLMAGAVGMMLGSMMSNNSFNSYKERQRSYGSSAYVPANPNRVNSFRATESRAQSAVRSAQATSARASSSSGSVSRGGFGGAVSSGG